MVFQLIVCNHCGCSLGKSFQNFCYDFIHGLVKMWLKERRSNVVNPVLGLVTSNCFIGQVGDSGKNTEVWINGIGLLQGWKWLGDMKNTLFMGGEYNILL